MEELLESLVKTIVFINTKCSWSPPLFPSAVVMKNNRIEEQEEQFENKYLVIQGKKNFIVPKKLDLWN